MSLILAEEPILILAASIHDERVELGFNDAMDSLPHEIKQKILRFRQKEDQKRSLLGKILLKEALAKRGLSHLATLKTLKWSKEGRPFIARNIDFNISHSGDWVVCALANQMLIGIDIEQIRSIEIDDFDRVMSHQQLQEINHHANPNQRFFEIWTAKEAIVKAHGQGLSLPIRDMTLDTKEGGWGYLRWSLMPINLPDQNYAGHIAYHKQQFI